MKNFFIILAMKILNIALKIAGKQGGNFLGKGPAGCPGPFQISI